MNLEEARRIWRGYGMSEWDLREWVWMVNNIPPAPQDVHVGETIEITWKKFYEHQQQRRGIQDTWCDPECEPSRARIQHDHMDQ